jgi:hypothetical protein
MDATAVAGISKSYPTVRIRGRGAGKINLTPHVPSCNYAKHTKDVWLKKI